MPNASPSNYWLTLLDNNGFAITNVLTDQFSFRYVDGTAFLNHFFIKLAFLPSWLEIVEEHAARRIFSQLENELNQQAQNGDGLTLTVPWVAIDATKSYESNQ